MLLRRRIINFAFGERVEALLIVQSNLNVTWCDLYFISGIHRKTLAINRHVNISSCGSPQPSLIILMRNQSVSYLADRTPSLRLDPS